MMVGPNVPTDGLCRAPALTIRAHQLLCTVCVKGGVDCPLMPQAEAVTVLTKVARDPTATIRLVSPADELLHHTRLGVPGAAKLDRLEVFNRKRDLDVLQRLGLVPEDVRRARYLYELLFEEIKTLEGICAYDTPGWEGCPEAHGSAYLRIRDEGWRALVYSRPLAECQEYRRRSEGKIATGEKLAIRPHHLMCACCFFAGGTGNASRPNDTIHEILERIRREPDVPITLVEGTCMACDCCDGFHPPTGRCVHACGLIRDYKKDLDVFQKLGLMPGDTLPARELFALLLKRIPSTRDICGYGDGIVRSPEWKICGGPDGNAGYARTVQTGILATCTVE